MLSGCAEAALHGSPLSVVEAVAAGRQRRSDNVAIVVDREGSLPALDPAHYDGMLTTCPRPPAPWVSVRPERLDAALDQVAARGASSPVATAMLARVLRLGEAMPFEAALELESLAYSALLGADAFRAWHAKAARGPAGPTPPAAVRYERHGDAVTLTLAAPANRNAMTAAMRDALFEALVNVLEDPSAPTLLLRGQGRCFSIGGALAEFGTASDLARAHLIRTARSAVWLLHRLGTRAAVHVHGACIGSGLEIAAAAARRTASADTFIQLPELAMGLIPGAGGTVSLAAAIGRHRLLMLALSGRRLPARIALKWGLFDAVTA